MKGNLISQGQKNSLLSKIFSFHRFARFSSTLQMLENKNALTLIPVNVSQLFGKTATTFLVFYVLFWNEIHLSLVFLPKSKHSFMGGRHLFILFFSNCHRRQTIQLEGIPKKVFLVDLPKSLCLCLFLCLYLCQVQCLTAYLQSPFMDLDLPKSLWCSAVAQTRILLSAIRQWKTSQKHLLLIHIYPFHSFDLWTYIVTDVHPLKKVHS